MLTIEKKSESGELSVIEADNYTVTLLEPNETTIRKSMSFLNADGGVIGNLNKNKHSEVLYNMCPSIGKALQSGNLLFVNSKNNPMDGVCAPIRPTLTHHGVVGSVDLDWVGYSGSSSVRGTMNLSESKKIINSANKVKNHIVVDFPSSACNGEFDTIYLYSNSRFTDKLDDNINDVKHVTFRPTIKGVKGKFPNSNYWYMNRFRGIVFDDDGFIAISDNSSYPEFLVHYNGVSKGVTQASLGFTVNTMYRIPVMIKGKLYIYDMGSDSITSSGTYSPANNQFLYEMNFSKTEDGFTIQMGEKQTLYDVILPLLTSATHKFKIYGSQMLGDITVMKGYDIANGKYFVKFLDNGLNVIKEETRTVSTTPELCFTFKKNDKVFYVINNVLYDYKLNSLGACDMNPPSTGAAYYYTNGIRNIMIHTWIYNLFATKSYTSSSYIELYELETWDNPILKIELEEPLNKNNAETLKLIFDFDITIE